MKPLRKRTILDAAISFAYRHRYEIAQGFMFAAFLLNHWNAPKVIDLSPTSPRQRRKKS